MEKEKRSGEEEIGEEEDEAVAEKEQGTTQAIRVFLSALSQHVQSRHGKKRSKSEARTICSEVLRFLAFSKAEEPQGVMNCGELDRYIQSLEGTVAAATRWPSSTKSRMQSSTCR